MFWLKACTRCHGDLHEIDEVGYHYVSCLQCGRTLTDAQDKALPRTPRRAQVRPLVLARAKVAA